MKRPWFAFVVIIAIGLLAGPPIVVAAQDSESPSPAASAPVSAAALVTGTIIRTIVGDEWDEEALVEYGVRERGRDHTGRIEMDDPRLSGDVVGTDNADRFCSGPCSQDTFVGDILWGTIEISNDGGTWAGTSVNTTDKSADGLGVTYYELVGTGAYEGLSAVLFETETTQGEFVLNGVIFPGDLPPDR